MVFLPKIEIRTAVLHREATPSWYHAGSKVLKVDEAHSILLLVYHGKVDRITVGLGMAGTWQSFGVIGRSRRVEERCS
jgi:hypothetical protein